MIVVRCLRVDRIMTAATAFVANALGAPLARTDSCMLEHLLNGFNIHKSLGFEMSPISVASQAAASWSRQLWI